MSVFSDELCLLMAERHMGVRELARLVPCNSGYISNLRSGRKRPSPQVAARMDHILAAEGRLAGLADQGTTWVRQSMVARKGSAVGDAVNLRGLATGSVSGDGRVWPHAAISNGLRIDVGELVMATAHESSDRAANVAGRSVPAASIDQLRGDIHRLARNYNDVPPLAFLLESRSVRDLAYWMAERTRRPGQSAELYLATGQICALMSVASFDLAVWPAAIEHAHAAASYAEMVGYGSLQAWAYGMQALTAYWCGRPREAATLADAGLGLAPAGTARARLYSISARAWSYVGAEDRTRAALALADQERESIGAAGGDELHDGIGGEFGWGPARQAMSAASALLRIGDPSGAAMRAREAIRLRMEDLTGGLVGMPARADLARAELAQGRLDAADDALAPVWDLPPEHRRHGLVERLSGVAGLLARPPFAGAATAQVLTGRIEAFTADSAVRALPPGQGEVPLPGAK